MNVEKSPRNRIVFVISSLSSGGAERVMTTLSNHLVDVYDISIITLAKCIPFYPIDPRVHIKYCMEVIPPSRNPIDSILLNIRLLRILKRTISECRPIVCISFLTRSNILTARAGKGLNIPVVISERNNPFEEDKSLSKVWKYLRKYSYPFADALVVQTEKIKNYYASWYPGTLAIIHNPLNPEFEDYSEVTRENIVLNVGRLSPQKNHRLLIDAFASIEKDNWKLVIVGDGPERSRLQEQIESLNCVDKVILVGNSSDIMSWYTRSSIFAFSSNFEGFPNALIEAMHFGLACISTDCPTGPSEIIDNGINGLLVPVGALNEFQNALKTLIEDAELRSGLSEKARKTGERFQIREIASQWIELIREVTP